MTDRLLVNGCLGVLRTGAHCCNLPERYGRWKTVHRRRNRWCDAGVWERVLDALTTDRDNQYLMEAQAVIPSMRNRKACTPHDTELYKQRNRIE